ncbi:hypothetical protein HZ326_20568 [Fusarium oxysporum f. sp. albedinis]|nr:hypothetical protein HZ326_20568 [Fusarium oxysporum f. sp. albedinis]
MVIPTMETLSVSKTYPEPTGLALPRSSMTSLASTRPCINTLEARGRRWYCKSCIRGTNSILRCCKFYRGAANCEGTYLGKKFRGIGGIL